MDIEKSIDRSILNLFLFPLSRYGLFHVAMPVVCLLVLFGLRVFLMHFYGPAIYFLVLVRVLGILTFFVWVDFFYYLIHCVRESAKGATQAPDSLFAMDSPFDTAGSFMDVALEYLYDAFPILLCFWPPFLYFLFMQRADLIFWMLLGAGTFYFPMQFLAVVMFGSGTGYNPWVILVSIVRTFFSYLLLVAQVALIVAVFVWLVRLFQGVWLTAVLILPLQLYFMILTAHLLGRFYFLKQAKLDWEV